jgi:His-Xaa-Ser system radical SAM maturase HxsC
MLKLSTRDIVPLTRPEGEKFVARITENSATPQVLRANQILLLRNSQTATTLPEGFQAYFLQGTADQDTFAEQSTPNVFLLPQTQEYLADGDVVRFDPQRHALATLFRRSSPFNSLLVTERCNNFCLMCSQPPKEIDDSYIVNELLTAIPLMDRATKEIGITGGEPTLLGPDLLRILQSLKSNLPSTAVHVLSNGRNFTDVDMVTAIAKLNHPDLMIGIPIYSDISNIHDYVVQADGAFDETIRGILNLKRHGIKVEIRVVIHKQTYSRLPQLANFLARNLLFVDHVALMGLEMMGFTKYNLEELWIDPAEYQQQLVEATETLARYRMHVSIYNHQLCLLDERIWKFSRKSISDWKNEYMPECTGCTKMSDCGGFFSSARLRYSKHIKAFD